MKSMSFSEESNVNDTNALPAYSEDYVAQLGRNDPCPCGSGKKYKKCCLARDQA